MNEYMKIAVDEARYGIKKNHGGPFGAVIVKDGKVISKAHNRVLKEKDSTCHAEISAIRKACKKLRSFDLSGCEIYTTGKPCPMCRSAIQWAKIERVYFGCDYDDAESIGFKEEIANGIGYTEIQIEKDACKDVYSEYSSKERQSY